MAKRILLVDDDLFIRDLYEEVLRNEGYEVEIATNGKDGHEKLTTEKFDAVLLDIMLPQLDGVGVLTKLKEAKIPFDFKKVILLTNLSHDMTIGQALEMGIAACLTKSAITPDELLAKVKEVLGEGPAVSSEVVNESI